MASFIKSTLITSRNLVYIISTLKPWYLSLLENIVILLGVVYLKVILLKYKLV